MSGWRNFVKKSRELRLGLGPASPGCEPGESWLGTCRSSARRRGCSVILPPAELPASAIAAFMPPGDLGSMRTAIAAMAWLILLQGAVTGQQTPARTDLARGI